MEKTVKIIVGANYGDEGKGNVTNAMVRKLGPSSTLVVRYNGGAQAAHRVVHKGLSHVFGHIGSGALQGADTYLTKDFIFNPYLLMKELKVLRDMGLNPKVFAHPDCRITTPYDVLYNQYIERQRGIHGRHGSCGVGIKATIDRTEHCKLHLRGMVPTPYRLSDRLAEIRQWYCDKIGYEKAPVEFTMNTSDHIKLDAEFMLDMHDAATSVGMIESSILNCYDNIVFEGAQGLGLSMNNTAEMPHLTPSMPGSEWPLTLLKSMPFKSKIEVIYVSRTYATRHGAGRLMYEVHDKSALGPDVKDTNPTNEFQGSMRYGKLDVMGLLSRMEKDSAAVYTKNLDITRSLALTCCDQLDSQLDDDMRSMLNLKYLFKSEEGDYDILG